MSTKTRNSKSKTNRRHSMKKRSGNITQKDPNQSQSLKYARNLSGKDNKYLEDDNRNEAPQFIDSLLKAKRIPPKYFNATDHYRIQSLEILRNISISCLEFQKDLLINYNESYYKIINEIFNSSKQSVTPENYLVLCDNINKKIFENINRTTSLINDIVATNLNSLSISLDIYHKYYKLFNVNSFSKKS
ncbi:MAG: hypothetical protein ACE5SW_10160 [Nitrososphaeraceae archaeon]